VIQVAPIAYSFLGGSFISPYLQRVEDAVHIAANNHSRGDVGEEQQYKRLLVRAVGMTVGMLFVKSSVVERVKWTQCAGVGVGYWDMGNKGACGIRIGLDDNELTFVAAHLAPMEGEVMRRNQDWENIVRGLVFEDVETSSSSRSSIIPDSSEAEPLLSQSDASPASYMGLYKPRNTIFFGGDLNYRTSLKPPEPDADKTYPQPSNYDNQQSSNTAGRLSIKELLGRDQLVQERLAGRTIHGFSEMPINFSPTYKYDNDAIAAPGPDVIPKPSDANMPGEDPVEGEEIWRWAKHRWPSWCDRILYLPASGLEGHVYTSLPLMSSSDHRAVALSVTLRADVATEENSSDLRSHPPFPLNPDWKAHRAAARRREIIVGIASYLALTMEGNAILLGLFGGGIAGYLMLRTLL
jgi:hypothetical protein